MFRVDTKEYNESAIIMSDNEIVNYLPRDTMTI